MPVIIIPIIAMAAIIGLSNFAVQYQINDWLTWGAFTYPVAFLVTDLTNRVAGPVKAGRGVCAGFAGGVVLALVLADMRIAVASGTAFLIAQLLDVALFDLLRSGQWWKAPLVSTLLASAVDTALFFSLPFAAPLPIGSAHITNDIASIPGLTLAFAERLKTRHGSLFVGPNDDDVTVALPSFVEGWTDGTGQMALSLLTGIIRPRVEEIFETVQEIIDSSGHAAIAGRNVVLTGGGSLLTGIDALARDILDRPVSLGRPIGLDGLKKDMSGPDFTTLAGTIAFAERRLEARHAVDVPAALPGRVGRMIRLGRWLRENF